VVICYSIHYSSNQLDTTKHVKYNEEFIQDGISRLKEDCRTQDQEQDQYRRCQETNTKTRPRKTTLLTAHYACQVPTQAGRVALLQSSDSSRLCWQA